MGIVVLKNNNAIYTGSITNPASGIFMPDGVSHPGKKRHP